MCSLLSAAISDEDGWEGTSHTTTSYSVHRGLLDTAQPRRGLYVSSHSERAGFFVLIIRHTLIHNISYLGCVYSCKKQISCVVAVVGLMFDHQFNDT